jgi:hypothetical protein
VRVPDNKRGTVTCPLCGSEWFHPETFDFFETWEQWQAETEAKRNLSVRAASGPATNIGFKPDYGLMLVRTGILPTTDLLFSDFHLFSLTVLGPASYSTTVDRVCDGLLHALSLDFDHFQFERVLENTDPYEAAKLLAEVSIDPVSPRSIDLGGPVVFGLRARLGKLQTAENKEQFIPLIAQEILPSVMPLMTGIIDEPGRYSTLETWEQYLTELHSLKPSVARSMSIERAQEIIQEKRDQQAR